MLLHRILSVSVGRHRVTKPLGKFSVSPVSHETTLPDINLEDSSWLTSKYLRRLNLASVIQYLALYQETRKGTNVGFHRRTCCEEIYFNVMFTFLDEE
jgi:hypothetical protein